MVGLKDPKWCRYNKNHDPNNLYFCTEDCIDLFIHDNKKAEFINVPCPLFPYSDNSAFIIESNKALDKLNYKGDRNKIKYV